MITSMPLGALGTNCFIIAGESGRAVVIDPASSAEVLEYLKANELTLGAIIITHGHYDHFAGVAELKAETGAEIIAPEADREMLQSAEKSWSDFMPVPFHPVTPDRTFADGDTLSVCGMEFSVMAAPGHTAGSCLLLCKTGSGERSEVIFAGDVIFNGSCGRTDGDSGSTAQMRESLRKIAALEGDYDIYCGHGTGTTLENERYCNPYLSDM